jgi:hypothetical protein
MNSTVKNPLSILPEQRENLIHHKQIQYVQNIICQVQVEILLPFGSKKRDSQLKPTRNHNLVGKFAKCKKMLK